MRDIAGRVKRIMQILQRIAVLPFGFKPEQTECFPVIIKFCDDVIPVDHLFALAFFVVIDVFDVTDRHCRPGMEHRLAVQQSGFVVHRCKDAAIGSCLPGDAAHRIGLRDKGI